MRFLFLTTKYPLSADDSYMTSELAQALRDEGHSVDVLHLDWSGPVGGATATRNEPGIRIVDVAPRAVAALGRVVFKASKFVLSARHARAELQRRFADTHYDAVIGWTPALTISTPLDWAIARGVKHRLLFVFDFFPIHHREIGLVPPGPVYWAAKAWEDHVYRKFTAIICNLPSNMRYLRDHYRLSKSQRILSTPLWSTTDMPDQQDRNSVRDRFGLPQERPIAIFGGQITEGRGIEQMLDAAALSERQGLDLIYLFVGDGRLRERVVEAAAASGNVRHLPAVPKEVYLPLVAACDVGMVATVKGVSSHSFPTKTMDYLRAGIPVVAAVEPGSDFVNILDRYSVLTAVPFDDGPAFHAAICQWLDRGDDPEAFRLRAARCLDETFHIRHTVATIMAAMAPPEQEQRS